MYIKEQLQAIFQGKFNATTWQGVLIQLFGAKELRETPELLDYSTDNETAYYLGKITMTDGLSLGLFRYQINKGSVVHKRVGLRNLVKTFTNPRYGIFDAALAVFDDGDNWRVSFISDISGETTAPKRYTFVFGDGGQYYHTAVSRFLKLQSDGISFKTLMEAFSVEVLTKQFYKELFDWYQLALSDKFGTVYPNDTNTPQDDRKIEEHLIRLITRLMFVWFIKQKGLIPKEIFDPNNLSEILKNFDSQSKESGNYYNAILQNLFFATLNRPINERDFASHSSNEKNDGKEHYGIKTLFRDDNIETYFRKSHEEILNIFKPVPFLNGGLFECLDKEIDNENKICYYDGFSRDNRNKNGMLVRTFIPNCLFFDSETGLISILKRYNFTIEENTPDDVEVALDPELLGKVFENLLGAYNPETKETARKQSGSFYTPREIVNYMVDESLVAYLKQSVNGQLEQEFRQLLSAANELSILNDKQKELICEAFLSCKILDPACGSGAFPMGILNRIIDILKKIQPNINIYETKLQLIENCIYGVDIQTIAIQISKLRFFISLIVEQTPNNNPNVNYGIIPLPNLESKFVAANTLIGLDESQKDKLNLDDEALIQMKNDLWDIRCHKNLRAVTWQEKTKLRKEDKALCLKIENYLLENTVKPDGEKIERNKQLIEQCDNEIAGLPEIWVDDFSKLSQLSMFDDNNSKSLFQKDINKEKRDKVFDRIKLLKVGIAKEERKTQSFGLEAEIKKMISWNPYDQNKSSDFFDPEWMFGLAKENAQDNSAGNGYFDIVIGNPPYVSTKGVSAEDKKSLEKEYGFADDTYTHFFFKGHNILNKNGILTYITPKTFWTTQTKRNLRDLLLSKTINYIFDTANPFEAAMVDTCITSVKNIETEHNKIRFLDGSKELNNPIHYTIAQSVYLNTQNSVIFKPTPENLKINQLYGQKVKDLYDTWWDKISTSKNIEKNKRVLEEYRNSLKPGDIALLGCLTEGGQGLATANNGKYIAVRKSTKWAKNILESRPKKLAEAIKTKKIPMPEMVGFVNTTDYLASLNEKEIAELFDNLKEQYGRDIFGQGYLYRLIDDDEIADVDTLTNDEKENGISSLKKHYVPYDKGDKDGNRWYLETPFAIAWSQENVGFLKADPKARYQGYMFYFKEGFCWTDVNSTFLKARLKKSGVFDVLSMSLFTQVNIPDWYFVCLINSRMISFYVDNFINNTSHFQINDARQLPVIIPTAEQLKEFETIFNSAVEIKRMQFSSQITINEAEEKLFMMQENFDKMVEELYDI